MLAGMGAVTDLGMKAEVSILLQRLIPCFLQERQLRTYPPLFSEISFFPGYFNPIIRFLWLGMVRLLFSCCSFTDGGCGNCCFYGFCGDCGSCSFWGILFGAELRYVPQLLTASTVQASAFHNHHHLPLSADDSFRNCLKTLPS